MSRRRATVEALTCLVLSLLMVGHMPAHGSPLPAEGPDVVHRQTYHVAFGPGRTLAVTEYFSERSELRKPARAAIFLTGPEFLGSFWTIPVEGYDPLTIAARRGFFAYTLDYVGVGDSYHPEDGSEVSYLTNVGPVREVVDFVRQARHVDRVDLIGEGYGGEIAAVLAAEPERVRSVVLGIMVYKRLNDEILGFFSPQFQDLVRSAPNGYWKPNYLELTLAHSPNEKLRQYVLDTQYQVYPTGPTLQTLDHGLPVIDAPAAKVPALILKGEHDPFPAPGDVEALAADWGGGARLVVISGAHHVPRIESEEVAARYFDEIFSFLDPVVPGREK